MSPNEMKALKALAEAYSEYEEFCFLNFKGIAARSGLEPRLVRRTVRSLARKGLAQYGKGLWTSDGELAGSGYCCTKAGYAAVPPPKSWVEAKAEIDAGWPDTSLLASEEHS